MSCLQGCSKINFKTKDSVLKRGQDSGLPMPDVSPRMLVTRCLRVTGLVTRVIMCRARGWTATNCSLGRSNQPAAETAGCLVCSLCLQQRPGCTGGWRPVFTKGPPFRYSLQPGLDIITLAQTRPTPQLQYFT